MNSSAKSEAQIVAAVDRESGMVTAGMVSDSRDLLAFVKSRKEALDGLLANASRLPREDQETLAALIEVADLARWLMAHVHDRDDRLRLCITANNHYGLPPEQYFLLLARTNPL